MKYFLKIYFLISLTLVLVACGGGSSLSEQQAIDTLLEARGETVQADTVKVNGMTRCDVSDESKVTYNIDQAWLVNYAFYSTIVEGDSTIALAIGEKNGIYSVVAQAMCP
jgi:hypothetical protein